MKLNLFKISFLLLGLWVLMPVSFAQSPKTNVLVFSKTAAFRHQSIEAGKKALAKMGAEKGFGVSFTEDAAQFRDDNLKKYNTVMLLSTTGDVLNNEQQAAFERYIQAGGRLRGDPHRYRYRVRMAVVRSTGGGLVSGSPLNTEQRAEREIHCDPKKSLGHAGYARHL